MAGAQELAVYFLVLWLWALLTAECKPGKWYTSPKISECGRCIATESTFLVHDVQILKDANGGDYVVSDIEFTHAFTYMRKMDIIITRCKGAALPSTCEYFTTWSFSTALCTMMNAKGMLWTPFVESIKPPVTCPVSPGKYRVNNGTFDLSILDLLMSRSGIYDFVWLVVVHVYDESPDLNVCFNVTFQALRMRRRH